MEVCTGGVSLEDCQQMFMDSTFPLKSIAIVFLEKNYLTCNLVKAKVSHVITTPP
jgi:hypothetical protein